MSDLKIIKVKSINNSKKIVEPINDKHKTIMENVYNKFMKEVLKKDSIKINNTIDFIKSLWLIINELNTLSYDEKKHIAIHTLNNIAAGKDGILNTPDDLIESHILYYLDMLIESDMIINIIDLMIENIPPLRCSVSICSFFASIFLKTK